jgi:uncharacterized membrane protein YadS
MKKESNEDKSKKKNHQILFFILSSIFNTSALIPESVYQLAK